MLSMTSVIYQRQSLMGETKRKHLHSCHAKASSKNPKKPLNKGKHEF